MRVIKFITLLLIGGMLLTACSDPKEAMPADKEQLEQVEPVEEVELEPVPLSAYH
ncbi:hypothetical protein [Bacillus sp. JCM 19034]|uniref:hypothetical protein n=1 Tax=Bacillus sp. JCM 19034 TaxID=1481928 RepID=UPI000A6590EA|nr:hypothetical protein [Bacillus sp. JCM 19034]